MASTNQEPTDDDKTDTMSFRERRLRKKNEMKATTDESDPDNDTVSARDRRHSRKMSVMQPTLDSDQNTDSTLHDKQNRKMSVNPNAEVKTFDDDYLESGSSLFDQTQMNPKIMENALAEQEQKLRQEFAETLHKETEALNARFDLILQNEQIRASYMLSEAYRERKEKVAALQQQLECKNLAALMYVMCAERTKCKMEKLKLIEMYTNYINLLNAVLEDGQELILHLSRGYKTAARIDFEWKEKMSKIIDQFLKYIYHYSGTPPEQNQFFFDLPQLLSVESPKEDDPDENPIEEESKEALQLSDLPAHKTWWEKLNNDNCRPFVVFGDMASFNPPQRRETLKTVKAAKTAPKKWTEYVFHEMFLNSGCPVADIVKHEYLSRLPDAADKWDCEGLHNNGVSQEFYSRRQTSVDLRGNMGSILKIILMRQRPHTTATRRNAFEARHAYDDDQTKSFKSTATGGLGEPVTKANLLGARDSMEIASTTKLRSTRKSVDVGKVELKVGNRRVSALHDVQKPSERAYDSRRDYNNPYKKNQLGSRGSDDLSAIEIPFGRRKTSTGHRDSLEVIPNHVPEADHKINYEKVCPMPRCQRMHVDSFTRSLPHYMQANPFTHFEQTFEEYEACTPEQIAILQQRIAEKKQHEKEKKNLMVNPLLEWADSVEGIGVQTSSFSGLSVLPPCTCRDPNPSLISLSGPGAAFSIKDLLPAKQNIDDVARNCFWNDMIEFDRFKVIGEKCEDFDARESLRKINAQFTKTRLQEIEKILKENPSLLDLFQANTK